MAFEIIQQDITKVEVDVVVNAANNELLRGGGVCGAIFQAAGIDALTDACNNIGYCATGEAVITNAFDLPARYIIHTVGPIWHGGTKGEASLLQACYENSLRLAVQHSCQSIAFPLISAGIYGYPKRQALEIATSTIKKFLMTSEVDLTVFLVVFDRQVVKISEQLALDVRRYLTENLQPFARTYSEPKLEYSALRGPEFRIEEMFELNDDQLELDETFSQKLLRFIDERGLTDPSVYKRANISRKHFSKIRNDIHYNPTKKTVIALAVALELSLEETDELLEAAGYTLSNSRKFDVIIKYFIERNIYDVFKINEVLFTFDEQLLGM